MKNMGSGGLNMASETAVLVVDDEMDVCRTLCDILDMNGYLVAAATTGEEALKRLEQQSYGVVVLDLQLPDMWGMELIDRIKQSQREVETIILTGHASLRTAIDAVAHSAFAYLQKPADMDQLLAIVRRACEKQRLSLENERLIRDLRASKEALEAKVAERTRELEEANRAAHESREHLENLLRSLTPAVWEISPGGTRFLYCNPALERLYGRPASEFQSNPSLWLETVYPQDRHVVAAAAKQLREHGKSEAEYRILRPDGEVRWVHDRKNAVLDANGRVDRIGTVVVDVTDRRRAQEEIRKLQERLSGMYNCSKDGMGFTSLDGTLLDVNEAFAALAGYSRQELLSGKTYQELTPGEYHAFQAEIVARILRTGKPEEYEKEYIRKDGTRVPVQLTTFVVKGGDGRPIGLAGIIRDITERKQTETRMKQMLEDLRRSNQELDRFAGVVAHDLHEPLRTVKNYVTDLTKRYEGQIDAEADRIIGLAVGAIERMQELINSLLVYARAGSRTLERVPISCEDVLAHVLFGLQAAIGESRAEVTHDPLPTVNADGRQIKQLFQNLVSNAIKFRSKEAPKIHIGAERKGGEWVFQVKDNGIGIEADYRERIFGAFQRLHPQTEYPGSGMGLAICKKIVERHGGRIWAESEPGMGSSFYFSLPASTSAEPTETNPPSADT
jgi:PAS domain S-box-containing protein